MSAPFTPDTEESSPYPGGSSSTSNAAAGMMDMTPDGGSSPDVDHDALEDGDDMGVDVDDVEDFDEDDDEDDREEDEEDDDEGGDISFPPNRRGIRRTSSGAPSDSTAPSTLANLGGANSAAGGSSGNNEGSVQKRKRYVRVVEVDSPNNLDLDAYAANYKGHTKVNRLEFIADHCPSLRVDALKMAIAELKATDSLNVNRYVNLVQKLQEAKIAAKASGTATTSTSNDSIDKGWMDAQGVKSKLQSERLETELKNYKNNSIKESIRMGYNELGDHSYECGDLAGALRAYSRTRDYCTTSKHIMDMCLNVIRVSIELGNFPHVLSFVAKAETTPEIQQDKELIKAKLKVSSGIANLDMHRYKVAARDFLSTGSELVSGQYGEVISGNDIAVYGGLCALASFSRHELKTLVLDNIAFRQYLELEPHIRDLIQGFYGSNYVVCLDILDKWRNDYLLDIHLHNHVENLYTLIRKKALVQYFKPFMTVDLVKMAKSFSTTVPILEAELVGLISEGLIAGRIDSEKKILWAKQANDRTLMYENALKMGQVYDREAKSLVLRIQMMNHDLIVSAPQPPMGAGGWSGPPGGGAGGGGGGAGNGNARSRGHPLGGGGGGGEGHFSEFMRSDQHWEGLQSRSGREGGRFGRH